jgi:hypothetical protein
MRRMMRLRPSPAIVVAVLALIAGVAGTAVAGPSADTSALTKKKVRKQINKLAPGIANAEIDKRFPVGTTGLADGAVTTPKLASGALSAGKLGNVVARVIEIPLPANGNEAENVFCQPGERLIGGGARSIGFNGWVVSSRPITSAGADPADGENDLSGWRAAAHNDTATATTFKIFAMCLQ